MKKTDASTLCGLCNSNATRIAGVVKFIFRARKTLAASKNASARPPVPLQGTHCCIHPGAKFLHAVLVPTNRPPALLFNVAAAGPTEENLGTLPVNEIAQNSRNQGHEAAWQFLSSGPSKVHQLGSPMPGRILC